MQGILRCSKYAFGPNRLHLCGPNQSQELLSYISSDFTDPGLEYMLGKFETMYPYLRHIAQYNHIRDPFDERVVTAYWLGNSLLENVRKQDLFVHLSDTLEMRKKMTLKEFLTLKEKIGLGGLPFHAFHVFNVWHMTSRYEKAQKVEQLDACRISVGKILAVDGPWITLRTRPIITDDRGRLVFGKSIKKKITRSLGADIDIDLVAVGNLITLHWDVPCEVITQEQAKNIDHYTQISLDLANNNVLE